MKKLVYPPTGVSVCVADDVADLMVTRGFIFKTENTSPAKKETSKQTKTPAKKAGKNGSKNA